MRNLSMILLCTLLILFPATGSQPEREHDAQIDVLETDKRYVIWRESDHYLMNDSLCFRCRSGTFLEVLISFDDGKTYENRTGRFLTDETNKREVIIKKEMLLSEQVCLKFMTEQKNTCHESREYRIRI